MVFPRGLSTLASVRRQLLKHSGDGRGANAYCDSEAGLGYIAEAIMLPRELPAPDYRFPPAP
jgi:hypothetical protein